MSLPNPHGNASGQIAHNSIYDTGQTPGSTGGKFIGFGEEGTSYITNRANWALSENIDYVYQVMAADRAIPAGASFTSAGQNTFQITDDVWVGDAGYPVSEAEGLLMLFAITDNQYNELTDGSGNEVRVAVVRNSANVTNVYKNDTAPVDGFETNPVITFKTVDSAGVDVQNPYTIPAAQAVRVLYGSKSSFEALPTDALVKFKLQSATEVEAGAFLQDGTKKMTGNADWDGYSLLNPDQIVGEAGADLLVRSQQDLNLQGDLGCYLKDQFLATKIPVSQTGETGISGYYTSLVGALNSKSDVAAPFYGNRFLSRTGAMSFTDGTGAVAWPTLTAVIDGERRIISAGSITATNNPAVIFVAALTAAGSVVERSPGSLLPTDVPLAAYTWTGAAFTKKVDIRWAYNGTTRHIEVTCGDDDTTDFTDQELDKAVTLACELAVSSLSALPVVRVLGRARAPSASPYMITLTAPIAILGNGWDHSIIASDETNGHTVDFIDCAGYRLIMKDLLVLNSANSPASTLGAIKNAGSWSVFSGVKFLKDGGTYDEPFANALLWTQAADHVLIENCHTSEGSDNAFVMGSNAALTTAYLTDSTIRDCFIESPSVYGIVANGDGNVISNVRIMTGTTTYGFVGGNDTLIDHCRVRMTGAGISAACVFYKPITGAALHNGLVVRDSAFLRCAGKGILADAINDTGMRARVVVRGCRFDQVAFAFDFTAVVAVHASSSVLIDGNEINDTDVFVAAFENIWHCQFSNNTCNAVNGDGVNVGSNAGCKILSNYFEGWGAGGFYLMLIKVLWGAPWVEIKDNFFGDVGAPAMSRQVDIWRKCDISGNTFVGSANASVGLHLNSWEFLVFDFPAAVSCTIVGNQFVGHSVASIKVVRGNATYSYYNGSTIANNLFAGTPDTGYSVHVDNVEGVTIANNEFSGSDGCAIRINGAGAGGADNHVTGNRFKAVLGKTSNAPYGYAIVAVLRTGAGGSRNCVVSDNIFHECGNSTPSGAIEQSIILADGASYIQVCNNHITGLTGGSAAADQSDLSHGIYLGAGYCDHGMVNGNYIFKDVGIAGAVADRFYGIRAEGDSISMSGNHIVFVGTQPDANTSNILYGIFVGATHTKIALFSNYVDTNCTIAGLTIQKSYLMQNDFSVAVGNYADGGDMDFTGSNKLLVGNFHMTVGAFLYTNNATNQPDPTTTYSASALVPMVDINTI